MHHPTPPEPQSAAWQVMQGLRRCMRFRHAAGKPAHWLFLLVMALFVLVALPFLALSGLSLRPPDYALWAHLHATVLWPAVMTTLFLMLGVGLFVGFIGVITAWLVSAFDFPGRRFFSFALLLPLALPTYVSAFAYIEFLGFSGPLQSAIRAVFGFTSIRDYWFPNYRSLMGAVLVMSFVLYPYVYLTARASFSMQTASLIDASRILGAGPWKLFFKIALPLSRPAILVGVALALMEAANDVGAVEFFGLKTLTSLIYTVWLNRASLVTASQIACLFLFVILLVLWCERYARQTQRLYQSGGKSTPAMRLRLTGGAAFAAFCLCLLPIALGFVVPVMMLLGSALTHVEQDKLNMLVNPILNALYLAGCATALTVTIGCLFAYLSHQWPRSIVSFFIRLTTLGYAVPGVVLAVGILIPLAAFDNALDYALRENFGLSTGLLLSGTSVAIIYAYAIRFLPMAYGSCDSAFQRLSPNFAFAARTLGRSETAVLREISLPLLRPALVTSAILVFVDGMKELPATLLLRPFNFDTLATRVYDAASLEIFEQGALPALAIVVVGLLPVALLALQEKRPY